MLNCAQSESGAKSIKKGLKDNNNRLLGIVKKFCIPSGTESTISICGEVGNSELSTFIGFFERTRGV